MKKYMFCVIFTLLLMFIPLVNATTSNLHYEGSTTIDFSTGYQTTVASADRFHSFVTFKDVETLKDVKQVYFYASDAKFSLGGSSDWQYVDFYIGSTYVGHGAYGYTKVIATSKVIVMVIFSEIDFTGYSGTQHVKFVDEGASYSSYVSLRTRFTAGSNTYARTSAPATNTHAYIGIQGTSYGGYTQWTAPDTAGTCDYTIITGYDYLIDYEYTEFSGIYTLNINRTTSHPLKIYLETGGIERVNDTTTYTTMLEYIENNESNNIFYFTATNEYDDILSRTISFIPTSSDIEITTDKNEYNTSETIELSWYNIDDYYTSYGYKDSKPYEMYILYYDYSLNKYVAKYQEFLEFSLSDETLYLDSSLFQPQTNYIAVIVSKDGSYLNSNTWIVSTEFSVIPDDEYLTLSCETPCYTYSGNTIQIYYRVNNNSVLRIYDSDKTLITSWNNLIDEGVKTYKIPTDTQKNYAYPNWLVYLNNTGYATSYNTSMLVYWSEYQVPTPTPTYTPIPINESIDEQITELKDEIQPLKDLIFGFSEIVIDNPDYDNNNIVTSDEFSNWINGLVSFVIVLFIVIMVIGLKDRR